jgi:hypothetical protein
MSRFQAAAGQLDSPLLHKDPELEDLAGEVELLNLPFKRKSR